MVTSAMPDIEISEECRVLIEGAVGPLRDRTAFAEWQLADTNRRGDVAAAAQVAAAGRIDLGLHHPRYHCHSIQARYSLCVTDDRIIKLHAFQIVLLKPIIRHFKCGERLEVPWIARAVWVSI